MSLKFVSLVLSSLALVSLCYNLSARVSTAGEGLRCADQLAESQREVQQLQSGVSRADARLADLNRTNAVRGGGGGGGPASRAGGPDGPDDGDGHGAELLSNQDIAAKTLELKRSNGDVRLYLAKLEKDVKTLQTFVKERALVIRKLADEVADLRALHRQMEKDLESAERKRNSGMS